MMTSKFENNVLTVVTGITKEVVEAGISNLIAKDEKGNDVYAVSVAKDGKGSISTFGLVGNTYVDGKLAVTMILPMGTTDADVKRTYGESLLAAQHYTKQIAEEAAAKTEAINGLFA